MRGPFAIVPAVTSFEVRTSHSASEPASRLLSRQLMQLVGATAMPRVVAGLAAAQCTEVQRFVDWMNPMSLRYAGAVFDYTSEVPDRRIASIHAPMLVIHAKDDTLQPYRNAPFFASTIPGATLLPFDTGGHLIGFIANETLRTAIQQQFLAGYEESHQPFGHE
jgi:predicted alpha/beta-fold hydrolase